MTAGELGVLLALLGSSLVALLLVQVARREAAEVRAQALLDATEVREATRQRDEESRRRLAEVRDAERRLNKQRTRADDMTEKSEVRAAEVARRAVESAQEQARQHGRLLAELEAVAGLSQEEASARLVAQMHEQAVQDAAASVHRVEAAARSRADDRARHVVATAVQRLAEIGRASCRERVF